MAVTPIRRRPSAALARGLALGLALGAASAGASAPSASEADYRFHRAREAYDAGRWTLAATRYRALAADGFDAPALWFNLGNALARAGDRAGAVQSYARALRDAPRDPDIQANLNFVLEEAGAPPPDSGRPPGRWLRGWPERVWRNTIRAGYGLAALGVGLVFWSRRGRRFWRGVAWAGAAIAALGLAGVAAWTFWEREPQAVVVESGIVARYAPASGATPAFDLPYAALVRIERAENGWRLVRLGGREGWVPDRSLAKIDHTAALDAAGEGARE